MPAKKNIFIFGDSITYGEWDSAGGWANRLRDHYDSGELPLPTDFVITYNLGIPSDTSEGVLHRLTHETQSRLAADPNEKEIQFIIAIGTNDARRNLKDKKNVVDIQQFASNIDNISKAAMQFSDDIVYVGLLPCIESDVIATGKRHDWEDFYDNQSLSRYSEVIKAHCVKHDHTFVDVFPVFEKCIDDATHKSLFSDGLHPNDDGHSLIFKEVLTRLNEIL